jgi:Cupin
VSKDIAGVNMRLTKGSFRELHWHLADEWALMLTGKARVTLFTSDNAMFVDDVDPGDLWLFTAGPRTRSRRSERMGASSCWCSIRATFPRRAPFFCRIG